MTHVRDLTDDLDSQEEREWVPRVSLIDWGRKPSEQGPQEHWSTWTPGAASLLILCCLFHSSFESGNSQTDH